MIDAEQCEPILLCIRHLAKVPNIEGCTGLSDSPASASTENSKSYFCRCWLVNCVVYVCG